jgi:nucleotide-binding universal stress UspA family protein
VRFRQLETGLPEEFQSAEELERQRKVHDKLIEKGLQLISDSFLDQVEKRCASAGVPLRRQLLEGINYEELINEVTNGTGRLPCLIGFDPDVAADYDGGERVRADVRLAANGRALGEDEPAAEVPAGRSGRQYDLVAMGAHGIGRQSRSQLGGVVARVTRSITRDVLVVKTDQSLRSGSIMVCVDGSSYSYRAMRVGLELAQTYGATLFVCSAFDVEFHHAVFRNIKDVLSVKASKVFKFEEQEELHNHIIDRSLLQLSQANIKRAQAMARDFPDVRVETQILIGKPFQVILQWVEEIAPTLVIVARHGSHRIEGTPMGSQAENVLRMAPANVLVTGTDGITPEDIPRIDEDAKAGLPWTREAELRIQRVPLFAQGIARRAVEEYTFERRGETVTVAWLDQAIQKLLPTHMQLIMGIGDAEEVASAEIEAEERLADTLVMGHDDDAEPAGATVEAVCPHSGRAVTRPRTVDDPPVWTAEAFARLTAVPVIARPLARATVERFAHRQGLWHITTATMDDNKQAMIEAEEFDAETMMGMFRELRARQIRAEAEGGDARSSELRRFIEESKASGVSRCPIRDIEEQGSACPVDFETLSPEQAKAAVEELMKQGEEDR